MYCSKAAKASQTCQWENIPLAIPNSPVHFMSAASRHNPSTDAITAAGVRSALKASASLRFFPVLR